jgi:hypothetical protein
VGIIAALAALALAAGAVGCGSGSSSSSTTTGPLASPATAPDTPAASPTESSPGSSIEEYGVAAQGAGKAAVAAAAHSFFTAMATRDYAGLCAGLAASNRRQLGVFLKGKPPSGCRSILKTLLNSTAVTEARKAAGAAITSVRVKGGTAFIILKPKNGVPSYFVMKEEGGDWKAISLAPGTPIDPSATP